MKCPRCNGSLGFMEANYITEEVNLKNLNNAEELLKEYANLKKKYFKEISLIYCSRCHDQEMVEE